MNHKKIYENIISNAQFENRKKLKKTSINYVYYENHHIIPKCLGGTNDAENLVLLTAREHYICHKLLTYIYKGDKKLMGAFHYMTFNKKEKRNISSRDYAYAKELNIKIRTGSKSSNETIEKQRKSMLGKNKGRKMKSEFGEMISIKLKGNIPWNKGKRGCYSDETRLKMSNSASGRKNSIESNEKNRNSHLGISTWNKGLTKETDIRILTISEKISNTLRKKQN